MKPFSLVLTVAALLWAGQAAHADLKTTSDVTVAADTEKGPSVTHHVVTTSVQGSLARVESDDGQVVLYDLKAGKAYWLDAAHKTYSVVPIGQLPPSGGRLTLKLTGKTKSDLKVKSDTQKKSIGGMDAGRVALTGTIETEPLASGTFWPNGGADDRNPTGSHMPGGSGLGGIPLGGIGQDSDDSDNTPETSQVTGEYWLTSALGVPDSLPWYAITLPADRQYLLPDVVSKMGAGGGVPLASHVVVTTSGGGMVGSRSVTVTTELSSVATTPLDRSLFLQPSDYRQAYPVPMMSP